MVLCVKANCVTVKDLLNGPDFIHGAEGEGEESDTSTPPTGTAVETPPVKEPDVFPRDYVETLRNENAARRKTEADLQAKIDAFESEKSEREKAEMTELERLKAERDEIEAARTQAETTLVNERKRNAVMAAASKLKFRDPEDVLAFINLEDVKLNEDGTPHKTSIESAVKKIADDKKYLIDGTGSADGGFRGDNPPPDSDKLKRLNQEFAERGGVRVGG